MNEQSIFTAALEQDPRNRSAFLDQACGADAKLRQRLETLVNLHENAGSFLDAAAAKGQGATDAQVPLERPGTQIGPYKLLQQIGEGGFGVVFMAEQEYPVRRRVALKIIKPGMGTRQVIARFEAERQALALMDHPNIAKVFDAGTTNPSQSPPQSDGTGDEFEPLADPGQPYFVMELVKGVPITEFCDRNKLPRVSD